MMDAVFGKTVFRAGSTVYAYDHFAFCIRKATVDSLIISDRFLMGKSETLISYNLRAIDQEMHGILLSGDRQIEPFLSPRIDDGMVFATLDEALVDIERRKEELRSKND